ncbi:MAG: YmdB family metallophosphoesterase [Helicobacter sp.]|nr:YmdB family metallophosphoesterase [Helicobacter sp.]
MRIGFVGDVVGKPGRTILKEHLQRLKFRERLDVVIANGENSSHGFGMTADSIGELLDSGIDVITGGNHSWDKKEILALLQSDLPILRPLNYPQTAPGSGIGIYQIGNDSLAVLNVMGHFAMPLVDNPFTLALAAVKTLHEQGIRHIFVDFHAEATSEKRAMFWLLSGHVSAVIGTHTHIGTDDLEIANGTLGLSDAGACGCMDGVLGFEKENVCERFTSGISRALQIPTKCTKILPLVVYETNSEGRCVLGYKIRVIDSNEPEIILQAYSYD